MTVDITTGTDRSADQALKAKHRAMWALGNYPAVVSDLISELGPTLADACAIQAGDRVLDVAGNPLDQSPAAAGLQPKTWTFTTK